MDFALCFKVQLLIIVLTSRYLLAIAFCELASSESMWWKCILVSANILGCSLLGLDTVISAHTEMMGNSHQNYETGGIGDDGSCSGIEMKCSLPFVHSLFPKEKRKCVPRTFFLILLLPAFLAKKKPNEKRHCR